MGLQSRVVTLVGRFQAARSGEEPRSHEIDVVLIGHFLLRLNEVANVLAGEIAKPVCAVRCGIVDDLRNLFRACLPSRPHAGEDRVRVGNKPFVIRQRSTLRLLLAHPFGEVGAGDATAGLDDFDDDVLRRQFVGQRLRKSFQGVFGGAIERHHRQPDQAGARADVDDQSALVLPEVRQHRPRDVHDAKDVDAELFLHLFACNPLEHAERAEARVIDQRVDSSESRGAGLDRLADAVAVLNVQSGYQHIVQGRQLGFPGWRAHGRDDVPAAVCKELGRCMADAGGCAGDQDCLLHYSRVKGARRMSSGRLAIFSSWVEG